MTVTTPSAPVAPALALGVTSTSATSPADTADTARRQTRPASSASASHRAPRARRTAGTDVLAQQRLRSVVVRLSRCMSALSPQRRKLLLLRAAIRNPGHDSRRDAARAVGIRLAREAGTERAALRNLRTAARRRRCGSTPEWVHVPTWDRLVLVDIALSTPSPGGRMVDWGEPQWIPAHQS